MHESHQQLPCPSCGCHVVSVTHNVRTQGAQEVYLVCGYTMLCRHMHMRTHSHTYELCDMGQVPKRVSNSARFFIAQTPVLKLQVCFALFATQVCGHSNFVHIDCTTLTAVYLQSACLHVICGVG